MALRRDWNKQEQIGQTSSKIQSQLDQPVKSRCTSWIKGGKCQVVQTAARVEGKKPCVMPFSQQKGYWVFELQIKLLILRLILKALLLYTLLNPEKIEGSWWVKDQLLEAVCYQWSYTTKPPWKCRFAVWGCYDIQAYFWRQVSAMDKLTFRHLNLLHQLETGNLDISPHAIITSKLGCCKPVCKVQTAQNVTADWCTRNQAHCTRT